MADARSMNRASRSSRWRWKSRWARASFSAARAARSGRVAMAIATPATTAMVNVAMSWTRSTT
ncbi:MAG: hypothetical protein LW698_09775 [Planctomycetaceae bacterium]|nr:hypothetical protein [Planctomycetaceae bacterium]